MHYILFSLLLVFTIGITATTLPRNTTIDVNHATAFALIYGYPLSLYVQTFEPAIEAVGTNTPQNQNHTATATNDVVDRPNVDTLYSKFVIDLSHSDLVLSIPEISDRFYDVPFYDLYGNSFANVGTDTDSLPGKYLITWARNDKPGIRTFNDTERNSTGYEGIIKYPTVYGCILLRILLKNNGTDVDIVHAIQAQINMTTIDREGGPLAQSLTSKLLGDGQLSNAAFQPPSNFTLNQTTETLQLLAKLHSSNPPEDKSDLQHVNTMLKAAGIKDGQYTPPAGIDYDQVSTLITDEFDAILTNPSNHGFNSNGWYDFLPSLSGNFNTHHTARAWIAWVGYLQVDQDEGIYPTYKDPTLPSGLPSLQLAANESYMMTFSEKPPVTGFWSMTAYNSTNYLIPNGLDRYSLGDRSNLTFADGTLVYANSSSNGAFSILIQPIDKAPSANWTNNWLPAPAGGGLFTVNLRWYGPTPALTNGTYQYPVVTKQGTIF